MTHTILAPLAIEAAAVRLGRGTGRVIRTGMGPDRAAGTAREIRDGHPVIVAGTCGALDDALSPGDLVVASSVRDLDGSGCPLPGSAPLVSALRRHGLPTHHAPIVTTDRVVRGPGRAELAERSGAVAVDLESAAVVAELRGADRPVPVAVVRVVVDTPEHRLLSPSIVTGGATAMRALAAATPAFDEWAASARDRQILLAGPRSFCAGVDRAIEIVEEALERYGPPVYVRKQIVHNAHVVAELEDRGAVFVDELDEVPDGALTIFSAHGVSPAVREDAAARGLDVIDATCPLVEKVHAEARRFARDGYDIVLIGHEGHEEVEGTSGEAPSVTHLVDEPSDIDDVDVRDPDRVAVLSQTTLAVDEVSEVIDGLRTRFPAIQAPKADDICYATQNRQDAVRAVASDAQLVLVVGSTNSSNSKRLVEVAERAGAEGHLVDDATEIDPRWLHDVDVVGLTAGASAPERLVQDIVDCLAGLGEVTIERRDVRDEDVVFTLPKQLRG